MMQYLKRRRIEEKEIKNILMKEGHVLLSFQCIRVAMWYHVVRGHCIELLVQIVN